MNRAAAIFTQALEDLARRMGVKREDISAEEMFALMRAAERVADPFREANADAAGIPVRVCEGVYLWRLTAGAAVWLDEGPARWWPDDPERYNRAFFFACRHAREPELLMAYDTPEKLARDIRIEFRRLGVTPAEIAAALDAVVGLAPARIHEDETARAAADWAAIIARVESQTGRPRKELAWLTSAGHLMRLYNDLHRFAAATRANGGDVHLRDELDEAVERLQRVKVDIMKRVKHG